MLFITTETFSINMVLKYLQILVFNLCFDIIQPYVIGFKFICLNFLAVFVGEKFFDLPALCQQAAEGKYLCFVLFLSLA